MGCVPVSSGSFFEGFVSWGEERECVKREEREFEGFEGTPLLPVEVEAEKHYTSHTQMLSSSTSPTLTSVQMSI